MDIELKKREIQEEIGRLQDEKLVWAVARLLHLDDEGDVPDWHKSILKERVEKYEKGDKKPLDWDQAQKDL
ncbi:MAG: addiction module protein [Chitinophagales bacterium]